MGFKSRFPFFNRDEVTPDETDTNPDVQSLIGRTLARVQGFSNVLGVFKFIRSDYNGKLHVAQSPTDFDNITLKSPLMVAGLNVLLVANPDRQEVFLVNVANNTLQLQFRFPDSSTFVFTAQPNDLIHLAGYTQQLEAVSTAGGETVRIWEI